MLQSDFLVNVKGQTKIGWKMDTYSDIHKIFTDFPGRYEVVEKWGHRQK